MSMDRALLEPAMSYSTPLFPTQEKKQQIKKQGLIQICWCLFQI